jgi:hypothetical protein
VVKGRPEQKKKRKKKEEGGGRERVSRKTRQQREKRLTGVGVGREARIVGRRNFNTNLVSVNE